MTLRLAEYNENKLERFIELNMSRDGFGYYGDRIVIRRFVKCLGYINEYLDTEDCYDLDEKDPLNRFNGRFDGRTYGNGRFVLVENDQDDLNFELGFDNKNSRSLDPNYEGHHLLIWGGNMGFKHFCENKDTSERSSIREQNEFTKELWDALKTCFPNEEIEKGWKKYTSIHENPELFEWLV